MWKKESIWADISDETKHRGHDKVQVVQVVILTCDRQGKVIDCKDTKMKVRYAFEPFIVLRTTSPSIKIESNWEDNISRSIDVLKRLVPDEANNCVGMMGADNAADARKERRKTGENFIGHLHKEGLHRWTYRPGGTKR